VLERLKSQRAAYALYLRGFPRAPIDDVRVIDCSFDGVEKGSLLEHASHVVVRNVRINGKPIDRLGEC
jgi:hypothetical protein